MRKGIRSLNRSRRVNRSRAGTVVLFLVMLVFACFMAFPLALIISNSFKPLDELWVFPPKLIPQSPTMSNFRDMFTVMSGSWVPFLRYIFNTVFITAAGTAGHIILASMCAYPLAKKQFPGRNLIFNVIVLALMFNGTVTAIPNYITMAAIGWIDTHLSLIVPAFAIPLGLYLMKQFMEQMIPDTILEAARIDGAGEARIFFRIVMPMVRPAWLTLIIFAFQGLWNTGASPYVFREELKTLNYALSQVLAGGVSRSGAAAAGSVLAMIVPIVMFVTTQSNIVETMATSGMKE